MKILIGTKNPGKIEGAKQAFEKYFDNVEIEGIPVNSNVGDQPINEEIFLGAKMDNLFYNVYGVAIHNVLPFLEKKCNIQNRNFTLLCHCCCCSFVCD